jgi:hypothetical protein
MALLTHLLLQWKQTVHLLVELILDEVLEVLRLFKGQAALALHCVYLWVALALLRINGRHALVQRLSDVQHIFPLLVYGDHIVVVGFNEEQHLVSLFKPEVCH